MRRIHGRGGEKYRLARRVPYHGAVDWDNTGGRNVRLFTGHPESIPPFGSWHLPDGRPTSSILLYVNRFWEKTR